jgi:acyl-CoA thioesterase I
MVDITTLFARITAVSDDFSGSGGQPSRGHGKGRLNLMRIYIGFILLALAVAAGAAGKIKVACIGNSITAGSNNYPSYLQTLLGSGYQVENEGVGATTLLKKGDVPYWTQGRLKPALAFNPDIVTIKLGTNDTKSQNWDAHGGEFKKDYLSMIDTFKTLTTKPDIFLVLPVPVFKANNYGIRDSVLKKIIVIIKEIGSERNLPIIDANTPLLGFSRYFSDGVHPNGAGSDSIAHIIYRALRAGTGVASEYGGVSMPAVRKRRCRSASIISFSDGHLAQYKIFDLAGRAVHFKKIGDNAGSRSTRVYLLENERGIPGRIVVLNKL